MTPDDERLLQQLAEGLAPEGRGPSGERVAEVRDHALRWRQRASPSSAAAPSVPAPSAGSSSGSSSAHAPVPLASRRRRREVLTGAVAATIGAALGAIGLEAIDDDPRPGPPTEPVDLAVTPPGVDAEAVLIDHTWGTEIILTATGLAPGGVYRAAVQPAGGGADVPAGSFLGVDGVPVVCRMNASILRAAASSFTVVDGQGATVITGRFT